MKTFLKVAGTVAGANLLCLWISYGLMAVVARWQLGHYGFDDPPVAFTIFFKLFFGIFILSGTPLVTIPLEGMHSEHMIILLVFCSVLNAVLWGTCFGLLIYAIKKRFRSIAA